VIAERIGSIGFNCVVLARAKDLLPNGKDLGVADREPERVAFAFSLGAGAHWRDKDCFQVNWLLPALPLRVHRALRIGVSLLAVAFLAPITWYCVDLVQRSTVLTRILELPTSLIYLSIQNTGLVLLFHPIAEPVQRIAGQNQSTETAA
jgi:TRAP-type C4-dicarboxylate transport system permease small subunit